MPIIENEVWLVYKDQGVKVLAIDQMESPIFVDDFITAKGITYEVIIDNDGSVTSQYIVRLPHNTLIDPSGKIVHTAPGLELDKIKQLIDEMLLTSNVQNTNLQPASFSLSIFPNPISLTKSQSQITFSLKSSNTQNGAIQIFNILGQQVHKINIAIPFSGQTNFIYDLRDKNNLPLPKGIYFARYLSGSENIMKRFVLLE